MIDRFNASDLKLSKEVQEKLDAEGIILVKEDDLSCMEEDYGEACDRLITCGIVAKEGLAATNIDDKGAFGIDDIILAHSIFDDILTEVES